LAIGAKQFVVHDALDINFESSLRSPSFTPNTTVASISSFGGTVKTTFLAPASICFSRDFLSAKIPVDSITISMSSSFQVILKDLQQRLILFLFHQFLIYLH